MKDHEHSCFVSIITALRTWEAHNAVLQFTVNLKGKFPKGLCAYVQPHTFEPYNIVLAEWEIAHTEFHRGTTSSPHPPLRKESADWETTNCIQPLLLEPYLPVSQILKHRGGGQIGHPALIAITKKFKVKNATEQSLLGIGKKVLQQSINWFPFPSNSASTKMESCSWCDNDITYAICSCTSVLHSQKHREDRCEATHRVSSSVITSGYSEFYFVWVDLVEVTWWWNCYTNWVHEKRLPLEWHLNQ